MTGHEAKGRLPRPSDRPGERGSRHVVGWRPGERRLPGVLSTAQFHQTAAALAAIQEADGAIPWHPGGEADPWDHVEAAMALDTCGRHEAAARAYRWLADRQNQDGSWHAGYQAGVVTQTRKEANFAAYLAVGLWHHAVSVRDASLLVQMWPTLARAIEFVISLQGPRGEVRWARDADGTVADAGLLAGSASVHQALRCALAAADQLGLPQPDWELAVGRLAHAIDRHPERFLPKDRYAMDWYYPVLGGVLRGPGAWRRLAGDWDRFVEPGLGVRCVADRPWVTGAETCELALTLAALGDRRRAAEVVASMQHLRADSGLYWTGYVFEDDAVWPQEQTSWTAAAMLLAVAAINGDAATLAVFGGAALPSGLDPAAIHCDDERCAEPG